MLKYSPAQTLSFSENDNCFKSFVSLFAEGMACLGNTFMSFKNGDIYTHDADGYNNFFGVQYPSNITMVFNQENPIRKKYGALGYQSRGNKAWAVPYAVTNTKNPQTGLMQESSLLEVDFVLEETVLTASLLRDKNSMADARVALLEGDYLGGNYIKMKLEMSANNAIELVSLVQPYLTYEISQRNF